MSFLPSDRLYTTNHFWIAQNKTESGIEITLGITPRGSEDLGELNFAELPVVGQIVHPGTGFGVIESVKSVQELVSPVAGKVVAVNPKVEENPEIVNDSPLEDGWLVKIETTPDADFSYLLNVADYQRHFQVR